MEELAKQERPPPPPRSTQATPAVPQGMQWTDAMAAQSQQIAELTRASSQLVVSQQQQSAQQQAQLQEMPQAQVAIAREAVHHQISTPPNP